MALDFRAFGDKSAPPVIAVTDTALRAEVDPEPEAKEYCEEEGQSEELKNDEERKEQDTDPTAVTASYQSLEDLGLEDKDEDETKELEGEQDTRSPQGEHIWNLILIEPVQSLVSFSTL